MNGKEGTNGAAGGRLGVLACTPPLRKAQAKKKHPCVDRVRSAIADICSATTIRGLVRFVRTHHGCLAGATIPLDPKRPKWHELAARWRPSGQADRWIPRDERWDSDERIRRRLKHDAEFRRRTRAALRRLATVAAGRYSPERHDKASEAVRRASQLGLTVPLRIDPRLDELPVKWRDLSYSPAAKDASARATLGSPSRDRRAGWTTWKNGTPRSYTRATDDSLVLSAARLNRDGSLDYWFQEPGGQREQWHHAAPDGLKWDRDANGLRLVRGPDDYHPTAAELRGGADALARMAEALRRNAEVRRRNAAEGAAEHADAEGVYVCLADSLRGGNCRAGTEAFGRRHGLDGHVPAGRLLDVAGAADLPRVRLAIRAATVRHRREMAQGYADLQDHDAWMVK